MKKRNSLTIKLLILVMVLISLLTTAPTILAAETTAAVNTAFSENQVSPLAEETGWYYRVVDGVAQKRLWSYTEGKWLTDWITIGYV